MPKATVSTEPRRYELETLPGGYVMLRPLTYGQKKDRADASGKMWWEVNQGGNRASRRNGGETNTGKVFMDAMNRAATFYDYQHCLVDHNLEDEAGNKLDFSQPHTLDVLDPRVGGEIEDLLARLNGDEDEMRDFTKSLGISQTPDDQAATAQK